jgi:hypothetical protein
VISGIKNAALFNSDTNESSLIALRYPAICKWTNQNKLLFVGIKSIALFESNGEMQLLSENGFEAKKLMVVSSSKN